MSPPPLRVFGRHLTQEAGCRRNSPAAARLRDPDFLAHARVRIALRCPLETTKLMSLSPVQRHVGYGPAGGRQRSANAAASLMQLVSVFRPVPAWWLKEQASPDLIALLSEDVDQSARIEEQWLLRLQAHLKLSASKTPRSW
jgi:hypothetical protein